MAISDYSSGLGWPKLPKTNVVEVFWKVGRLNSTSIFSSLVFSSSLITTSCDGSIKFWQVGILPTDPAATPEYLISIPAQIVSVSLLANNGIAVSCDSAGAVRTWDVSTGLCKASFCAPTRGMVEWGEAGVIGGRLIFGWCGGKEICLWDTERGELLQMVNIGSYFLTLSLRISEDGSKIFLLDDKSIRAWSIQTAKIAGEVEFVGKPFFNSLFLDDSKVWVRFEDSQSQGWDFGLVGSLTPSVPLSSSSAPPALRPRLDFIDRTGAWHTEPSRIEDTVTGEEVFRLSGTYKKPNAARWDGRYPVAGYPSGEVVILDDSSVEVCGVHSTVFTTDNASTQPDTCVPPRKKFSGGVWTGKLHSSGIPLTFLLQR